MEDSTFSKLAEVILNKGNPDYELSQSDTTDQNAYLQAVYHIVRKEADQHLETIQKFFQDLSEKRICSFGGNKSAEVYNAITFVVCRENSVGSVTPNHRAIVLTGKAVSIYKRSNYRKESDRNQQIQDELRQLIEKTTTKLFNEGKLIQGKNQSEELIDILMNYDFRENNIEPIHGGSQIFNSFFALKPTILMILPGKHKPDIFQFMKNTLLHVYMEHCQSFHKIATKEHFHRNCVLKGIYFIEEGEVEVDSGRVIAKGWVTKGKCLNPGYGWRFKPIPFIRFVVRSHNIWKQFLNDLTLNKEYPFKITNILNLPEEFESEISGLMSGKLKKLQVRLPKIVSNENFDMQKYAQIGKVRHYDDKFNMMCQYKSAILDRKQAASDPNDQGLKRFISNQLSSRDLKLAQIFKKKHSATNSQSCKPSLHSHSSSSNVLLILSVMRKLDNQMEPLEVSGSKRQKSPLKRSRIERKKERGSKKTNHKKGLRNMCVH